MQNTQVLGKEVIFKLSQKVKIKFGRMSGKMFRFRYLLSFITFIRTLKMRKSNFTACVDRVHELVYFLHGKLLYFHLGMKVVLMFKTCLKLAN